MKGLPESETVWALGLRVAILVDRTDPGVLPGAPRTREERAVVRISREARLRRRPVKVLGLSKPDIVEYLPDAVCISVAPKFPGWKKAVEAWKGSLGGLA